MSLTDFGQYEVTYTAQSKIRCLGCSKRLSRQRTFRAPMEPGRARVDIRTELMDLARRWAAGLRGVCASCMSTGQYVMLDDGNFALKFPPQGVSAY